MANQHLARIEAQLERLFEGAFAQLFRQRVTAQEVLLHLARALEENYEPPEGDDPRLIGPDRFTVHLHPDVQQHLLRHEPHLVALLAEHVAELSSSLEYRLLHVPTILIAADDTLGYTQVHVETQHRARKKDATASLKRVDVRASERHVQGPQLLIDGHEPYELTTDIVNIGRSRDNEIMLDDPYVSRHHAQLRLRFGSYMVFDNDSQGGTYVNDVRIREHRLQPGDVIMMGNTRLLYIEEGEPGWQSQTDIYPMHPQ